MGRYTGKLRVNQRVKKVVSDSQGLVDFATGLVNSSLNLPDGQAKFFGEFTVIDPWTDSWTSRF